MKTIGIPVIIPRVFLAALFAFAVLMQVLSLPGQFAPDGQGPSEQQTLAWTLLVVAELEMVARQHVIVCTWRLLTLVRRDRIFSPESLTWVDVLVWTFVAGWALFAGLAILVTALIYLTPALRDPGTPILLFGATLVGAVFVLLMVVLRALLRQAVALRSEMEEVI